MGEVGGRVRLSVAGIALLACAIACELLGFAGMGRAASPGICTDPSTTTHPASCVTQVVVPHTLTVGALAQAQLGAVVALGERDPHRAGAGQVRRGRDIRLGSL